MNKLDTNVFNATCPLQTCVNSCNIALLHMKGSGNTDLIMLNNSILLNQAATPCCWCHATTHRPTLHLQHCMLVLNAALLHCTSAHLLLKDGIHTDGRTQDNVRRNAAVLEQHHMHSGDHIVESTGKRSASSTHQQSHKEQGRKSTKGAWKGTRSTAPENVSLSEDLKPHGRHISPGEGHGQGAGSPL